MLESYAARSFIGTSFNCFQFNAQHVFAHRVGSTSNRHLAQNISVPSSLTQVCLDTSLVAASGRQKQTLLIRNEFGSIMKHMKHSSFPVCHRRVHIYKTVAACTLMCGLSCFCLSAAEHRRLDGFQSRCLCRGTGIPPSFFPVFQARMFYIGHAATPFLTCSYNASCFCSAMSQDLHSTTLCTHLRTCYKHVRRAGQPRREWVSEVVRSRVK